MDVELEGLGAADVAVQKFAEQNNFKIISIKIKRLNKNNRYKYGDYNNDNATHRIIATLTKNI